MISSLPLVCGQREGQKRLCRVVGIPMHRCSGFKWRQKETGANSDSAGRARTRMISPLPLAAGQGEGWGGVSLQRNNHPDGPLIPTLLWITPQPPQTFPPQRFIHKPVDSVLSMAAWLQQHHGPVSEVQPATPAELGASEPPPSPDIKHIATHLFIHSHGRRRVLPDSRGTRLRRRRATALFFPCLIHKARTAVDKPRLRPT